MPTLSLIGSVAGAAILGFIYMDDRHVAMDQYSQDMNGLITQQKAAERRAIQRSIRRIKSGARIEGRDLTPMELDDLDELQDQLDEVTPNDSGG